MIGDSIAAIALHYLDRGRGMTNQLARVNLSIASPSEIERTSRQLRTLRENFLSTGSLATYTPRSMILDSWLRCSDMHVNPSRHCAPVAIASEYKLYPRSGPTAR